MRLLEAWMIRKGRNTEKAVIAIRGMQGQRCVSSARSALSLIRGVEAVEISLESGRATVSYDPERADASQFPVAVQAVGFQAEVLEQEPV
jgi:Copper chaperone